MDDTNTADERLKREPGPSRRSRKADNREFSENREYTDDERLQMFRQRHHRSILPDLPKMDGFHVCWLTTTDTSDTIQSRERYGYRLLRKDEVPGFESFNHKTAEYADFIVVNEMIAACIPIDLYNAYMQDAHHDTPRSEEESITEAVENYRRQANDYGADFRPDSDEEDGMNALRNKRRAPRSW